MVNNPSCNAGDAGSIPGQGTKIPHAAGQLSPRVTTREPASCNYRAHMLWSPCATTRQKPTLLSTNWAVESFWWILAICAQLNKVIIYACIPELEEEDSTGVLFARDSWQCRQLL